MPIVPSSLIPQLENAANTALSGVFASASPSTEVDFIAAVVLSGVTDIAAGWKPILARAGITLSIAGVFCHAAPKATFKSQTCELADLLVVIDDVTNGKLTARRAVLVQAKLATTAGSARIGSGKPSIQLDLYRHWHVFTLPKTFDSRSRDFSACTLSGVTLDDGRYGVIDKSIASPTWHQVRPAASPMHTAGSPELGSFMARMTEGGSVGFGREAIASGTDDWSFTIDELLKITASQNFSHGSAKWSRGNTKLALLAPMHVNTPTGASSVAIALDLPPSAGGPVEPPPGGEERGISTIRVMLSRR